MRRLLALILLVCALASLQTVRSEPSENQKKMSEQLVIVPFGEIDGSVLSALAETLKDDLELSCTVAKSLAIPSPAYNAARRQHLSTRLLEEMQRHLGDEGVRLLGVVNKDL